MNLYRRVPQLFTGLALYGVSMALMIESGLGLNPWGTVGVGTIAYALAIGPLVHLFLPPLTVPEAARSDLPDTFASR